MRVAAWGTLVVGLVACGRVGFQLSVDESPDAGNADANRSFATIDDASPQNPDPTVVPVPDGAPVPTPDGTETAVPDAAEVATPDAAQANTPDASPISCPAGWWNSGWAQRLPITIQSGLTPTRLTDFPVLVTLEPTDIDYAAAGVNGASLRFVDSDGTTILPHEVERWNPGGQSVIWVRTTVDPNPGAGFRMYFDNAAAPNTSTTLVWTGYESVHHLSDSLLDATANGHNGSSLAPPSHSTGFIGRGTRFNGTQWFELAGEPSFDFVNSLTISLWFRVNAGWDRQWETLVAKGDHTFRIHRDEFASSLEFGTTSGAHDNMPGFIPVDDGLWHHVAVVYDGSRKYLYIDGSLDNSSAWSRSISNRDHTVYVGENNEETGRFFDGDIDELRITSTPHSAAWIAAEVAMAGGGAVAVGLTEQCE